MSSDMDVDVKGYRSRSFHEVRIMAGGGGPWAPEIIFNFGREGVRVSVFNPFTHPDKSWTVVYDDQQSGADGNREET